MQRMVSRSTRCRACGKEHTMVSVSLASRCGLCVWIQLLSPGDQLSAFISLALGPQLPRLQLSLSGPSWPCGSVSSSLLWSSDPQSLGSLALCSACCGQLRGPFSSPLLGPGMDTWAAPGLLPGPGPATHGTGAGPWLPGAPASFWEGQSTPPRAAALQRGHV